MQEYQRARVAAGAAIFRGDQILLLHRSPRVSNPGAWDLPGGRLEPGESLSRGARREVREETGLDVRIGPLFHAELFGSLSKSGRIRPTLEVFFHCAAPARKAPRVDSRAHTEYAWVRASELRDYPTAPHLQRTVRAAFRSKRVRAGVRRAVTSRGVSPTLFHVTLPVPA
ncbi:MAG: NUDIX domain-containing protein [Thermoplasmata archaeon]